MIQEGSKLVFSYTNILEELNLNVVAQQYEMTLPLETEDPAETELLRHFREQSSHIDDTRKSASLPIIFVSSMLSVLEMKGKVKQVGCMHYIRMQEGSMVYDN